MKAKGSNAKRLEILAALMDYVSFAGSGIFANSFLPGKDDHTSAIYPGRRYFGHDDTGDRTLFEETYPRRADHQVRVHARKWGNEDRQPYLQQRAAGRSYHRPHWRRSGHRCRSARSGRSIRSNKFICGSSHSTYHWVFITRGDAGLKSMEALRSASGVLELGPRRWDTPTILCGELSLI